MHCNLEYKYFLLVSLWLYLHHWLQCSFIAKSNHCCKATHSKLSITLFWNTHIHTLKSWEVFRIFRFCVPRTVWLGRFSNLVLYVNTSNVNFYCCVTLVLITGLSLWVTLSQSAVNKVAQDHYFLPSLQFSPQLPIYQYFIHITHQNH